MLLGWWRFFRLLVAVCSSVAGGLLVRWWRFARPWVAICSNVGGGFLVCWWRFPRLLVAVSSSVGGICSSVCGGLLVCWWRPSCKTVLAAVGGRGGDRSFGLQGLLYSAPLPACLHSHTARSRSFAPLSRACAHTTHCRRVSLALRISSECTVDVCAEINAAAPPDQQRFPVSCEVTGLRSEKRYRLRPKLRCLPCSLRPRSGG